MAEGVGADTFPKLLLENVRIRGDRPAIREKDYGIWQTWTWRQVGEEVQALAAGLSVLGLKRGGKLAIVGDNRPQLYWAIAAAQCLGAVPVPVYQDSIATEMQFVLEHAEATIALAEDQEQVDKLLQIQEGYAGLKTIIYKDPRGMRGYDQPGLVSLDDLLAQGRKQLAEHSGFMAAEIAQGKGSDTAIIAYTSGTTGQPKGVVLTFTNIIAAAQAGCELENLTDREESLAYLPMAWVGDHIFSYGQAYLAGFCVSCPENGATVLNDLREIGPTYFFAPPRIFENILTTVSIRMEDAGWLKRKLYHYFMGVARRSGIKILDKQPVSLSERLLYALGNLLVYGPLKNTLGFSRIRLVYTAGEAIGPDIFDFYRSLGLNMKQLYGSTETAVFVCVQPDGKIKADTVGPPVKGVEIKIHESGEVLVRAPSLFDSYFKNEQATAEAKTADGFFHTGDAGYFDEDGQLKIIDRAKDVGHLRDGSLLPPKYLENKLKFFPFIKEAVAFGGGRDYVAAFINIDLQAVGNWAERRGLPYASYQELAAKPEVYDLIAECVDKVNADLARDPKLAAAQIRRFLILHKELDADDGELTRTRKVRRRFIAERYAPLIDGLYSGAKRANIETQVTFEDGRKGVLKADLVIRDAEGAAPALLKKAS